MNKNVSTLYKIALKKERFIIGLMSGTSMDGLDVALCKIGGKGLKTKIKLERFDTVPYSVEVKEKIGDVFAREQVDFEKLTMLNPWLGRLHGDMVLGCLKKWKVKPAKVDIIASHGQTVFHSPEFLHPTEKINATLQIGDGDHVAMTTGVITLSDFRQKHIAAGGEGAPLAVYGDFLLLSHRTENRILLNIGGIGNFTFLPAGFDPKKVFVTDTGPGNTMIDQAIRRWIPGEYFDHNAQHASRGKYHPQLLKELKSDRFFKLPFPRTTGPELFNLGYLAGAQKRSATSGLSPDDLLATLTRFSAETIAESIQSVTKGKRFEVYFSGGGAHNPLLVKWIMELLGIKKIRTTGELGVPGDAKEAMLFAVLANEALAGGEINFGKRARIPSVSMGKVSFPD